MMHKRKVALVTIVVIAFILLIAAWLGRYSDKLKGIDTSDIKEITFVNSYDNVTITEPDEVQLLFTTLKAMKFRKMMNYHRYGTALLIDITLISGDKLSMSILSDNIIINGQNYKPKRDYSEDIRSIFDALSQK